MLPFIIRVLSIRFYVVLCGFRQGPSELLEHFVTHCFAFVEFHLFENTQSVFENQHGSPIKGKKDVVSC